MAFKYSFPRKALVNYKDPESAFRVLIRAIELMQIQLTKNLTPETWTAPTLGNSWVNYGSPFDVTGYYKDPFDRVHLRGVVKDGTLNTTMFTLAAGYRPSVGVVFPAISNGAIGRLDVTAAGLVVPTSGNNTYFSLNGASFRIA